MSSRLVLVGGGLQNALIALAVLHREPRASIVLIEREDRLGGNHTWSFHASDVPCAIAPLLESLVTGRWAGHTVAFPGFARTVHVPYASISSERLHEIVTAAFRSAPGAELRLGTAVSRVERDSVSTSAGERIIGTRIVDARGPRMGPGPAGYQKFLGLEVRLGSRWPLALPRLIDARMKQGDGFSFIYTLPFEPDRVLVEATAYSTSPRLDDATMRARVRTYLEEHGAQVQEVIREERGVLPLPLVPFVPQHGEPLTGGFAGGWFHPTTGYSFPVAARLASVIAEAWPDWPSERLARVAAALGRQIRFCALLNRLLFEATADGDRWRILERFHRLPEATIQRFYALRTTRSDRVRILLGWPPRGVSWMRAAQAWSSG
jgi:lycopene beta-cyclase